MKRSKNSDGRHAVSLLEDLASIQREIMVTRRPQTPISLAEGFRKAVTLILEESRRKGKIVFIGNGGSAAIASHQAVDYWKNGGIPAIAFNDASLLTCLGNDYGFEHLFAVPIRRFAERGDMVIAISSSGKSANILNGAQAALAKGCRVITLSGYAPNNPLRRLGHLNFYVPSSSYGVVEISHLSILHAMLREVIALNPRANKKGY
jgi:D-sedoheptulose 7-phosphate isomerase